MKVNIPNFSAKQNKAIAIGQALRTAKCVQGQLQGLLTHLEDNFKVEANYYNIRAHTQLSKYFISNTIDTLTELNLMLALANRQAKEEAKAAKRTAKQLEA